MNADRSMCTYVGYGILNRISLLLWSYQKVWTTCAKNVHQFCFKDSLKQKTLDEQKGILVIESGRAVVECLTQDRGGCGFEPHWHHCVVSLSKTLYPCLVLLQPRNTHTDKITNCWLGLKESNQTNKQMIESSYQYQSLLFKSLPPAKFFMIFVVCWFCWFF